ncbi:hypothetical protein ACSX1A_10940 [Pontibacter sp. MBLB2868]|uniref:hypothetical protein n=1 Tax=Pontibacter sp. MBLB2868 TaxID=3451555 RepID=UPI003F74CEB2
MERISKEQLKTIKGGIVEPTSKEEYCSTLWTILTGGNYQGDILYGWETYASNCVN